MKGWTLFFFTCLATLSISSAGYAGPCTRKPSELFRARQNGKWGYIDKQGHMVVPPRFNGEIGRFSEGLAWVQIDRDFGYIDTIGKVVVPPRYHYTGDFSEGLAMVRIGDNCHDGKCAYIDTTGKYVIEPDPQFLVLQDFSEGLAPVFSIGKKLRWGPSGPRGKWGYVDRTGKLVIAARFDLAGAFSEGLACIKMNGKYGFIDRMGTIVIPPRFAAVYGLGSESLIGFCDGLAPVKAEMASPWGYIDTRGRMVISQQFEKAERFSEGLAPIKVIGGKWGYIDKTGSVVIEPRYDEAKSFSDGLARVKVFGQYGYINTAGDIVIKPQFNTARDFSGGVAEVHRGEQSSAYSMIDKTGKYIWRSEE